VEFKDYKPVQFTNPSVLQDSCSADVDLLSLSPRPQLKVNTLDKDGSKYTNRRSNVKMYDVIDGIPQKM